MRSLVACRIIGAEIARDTRARFRRATDSGAQSHHQSVEEAVDYALSSARLILERGRVKSIEGARVLELGPGDHLGLGLCLVAWGAESVTALDRFVVSYQPDRQREIYRRLAARFDGVEAQRLARIVGPDGSLRSDQVRLVRGFGIEDATPQRFDGAFDVILSVAVGEHLSDVAQALGVMNSLLTPGGVQVHQVDLRDHNIFTHAGLSPLEWLTTSEHVHRLMVRNRGAPNRTLAPDYRAILSGLSAISRVTITRVAGDSTDLDPYPEELREGEHYGASQVELVAAVRPRLARRFRGWRAADLLAAGLLVESRRT